jgi:peptidyl-tRNA hydrolase
MAHGYPTRILRHNLGRVSSRLPGTSETAFSGTRPGNNVSSLITNSNLGIVKSCQYMNHSGRDILTPFGTPDFDVI